jgi:hypothetical protein
MMGETKSGVQRARHLRPRCIGAAGPRIRKPVYLSLHHNFKITFLFIIEQKTDMLLFNEHYFLIFKSNTEKDVKLTKHLSRLRTQQ